MTTADLRDHRQILTTAAELRGHRQTLTTAADLRGHRQTMITPADLRGCLQIADCVTLNFLALLPRKSMKIMTIITMRTATAMRTAISAVPIAVAVAITVQNLQLTPNHPP